jgi:uncharacterized Zn finger protein
MNDVIRKSIRLNFNCPNCTSRTFDIRRVGPHYGAYCADCGSYVKWLSKAEKKTYDISPVKTIVETQSLKDELSHNDLEVPW